MKEQLTFELLIDKLRNNIPFSWSRWGDGEWTALLQTRKEGSMNCDGHHFFLDMGSHLEGVLESIPKYFLGIQNLAKEQNKDNQKFNALVDINQWCDNEMLTRASIKGYIDQFFDAINASENQVMLIGNKNLAKLDKVNFDWYLEIPEKDCWLERDQIESQIRGFIEMSDDKENVIILYSASMLTNVLMDDIYNSQYGPEITQIDCGSVFDYYVGINSRSYMKKLALTK